MLNLLEPINSFGQQFGFSSVKRLDFLSPQVADFMKNGNIPVSYYAGQTNFSIPLFQLKTKGFNIPISINYNSAGFKPDAQTGPTGMNWYLVAEGAITRKQNGEPDDKTLNCSEVHPDGYFVGTKSNTSSVDASVWDFSAFSTVSTCGFFYMGYEYSHDEFSFNCLGHSGKFYMTYGGNVRVVSNEDVKVDLTKFTIQNYDNIEPVASTIVLTTADGYKFTFGGNIENLDYTIDMALPRAIKYHNVINTWHLTKVVSPEGNEIRYVYKAFTSSITTDAIGKNPNFYIMNKTYNTETENSYSESEFNGSVIKNEQTQSAQQLDSYSLTKSAILDTIKSDDFTLGFSYSLKASKFYISSGGSVDQSPYHQLNYQLDGITLKNKSGKLIGQTTFNYKYLGGTNGTRHFLTSLQLYGQTPYTFNYYRTSEIPSSYTRNIDHWGYWQGGNDENANMIPDVSQDASGNQIISSTLRDPNPAYCNVGLLQKVTYPTKGSTTFLYEAHDYSKRLERRADSLFIPNLYAVNGVAGGARIKSIIDSTADGLASLRTYNYNSNYITGGTASSGTLMDWPRYIYYWKYTYNTEKQITIKMRGSSFHNNYNTEENYINYGEVTEITSGNGYKVMKFNNYSSNPDSKDITMHDFNTSVTMYLDNPNLYKNYVGFALNDRSKERGLVNFEGYYDNNKTLIKSTTTGYPAFNQLTTDYLVTTLNSGQSVEAYKIYTTAYRPISSNVYTIGVTPLIENKSMTYDSNFHNLRTVSIGKSDGKTNTQINSYPNDYASGTTFIDDMVTSGVTGLPIEQVKYVTNGTKTSIFAGQITQYYTGGKGWPQLIYNLETNAPIDLSGFKFSNRATGTLPSAGTPAVFGMDSRYQPLMNYTQYDGIGNPLEIIPTLYYKGVPTAYKFGYNRQFPIAQVKNSKLNDIYVENFEDNIASFDASITKDSIQVHTGLYSGKIVNAGPGEVYSFSSQTIAINTGTARQFTYSGWVYSNGPSTQLWLFMYRAGETANAFYLDNITSTAINKWTYVTKTFMVPADVVNIKMRVDNNAAGTTWFDDLAIRPAEAQLSTYTYIPFLGMSSKIEGNGNTTYFDYDSNNLLKDIKDQNGNFIKSYLNNYKN